MMICPNNEYDFQEQLISERVPIIQVPQFHSLMSSRRTIPNPKLSNQTLKNIQLYLLQDKNKQLMRINELKAKQQFIGQEISKQQQRKQNKLRAIEIQQKQKAMKQCTFKPNVKSTGARRNLDEFLENQNEYVKKVQAKKDHLKKMIESKKAQETYKPKINKSLSSKSRASRRSGVPIYERLYSLKDNKQNFLTQSNIDQMNIENTFMPKISNKSKKMSRNAPIQQLLYGDALRRQQKDKDVMYTATHQNFNHIHDASRISTQTVNRNKNQLNNEKFAAQKFIREYFNVLEYLQINLSLHHQIDYIMFNEILKGMRFIPESQRQQPLMNPNDDSLNENLSANNNSAVDCPTSIHQRALVHDAHELLSQYGVNARNVCVFLLGLVGIYHINPINFEQGQESIPEKQFNLDQTDGRKMQRHFDSLFRNRLGSQDQSRQHQHKLRTTTPADSENTFQPRINANSDQLAEKHRTQMLEQANELLENYPELEYIVPEDGIISHTDLLVLNKMAKDIQTQQKRQDKANKGMQQCTFKPTTLSSLQQTMTNSKMSEFMNAGNGNANEPSLGQKKSFQLYNYHKSLQSKKNSLHQSRQQNIESTLDNQCTFAPNLKKQKVPGSGSGSGGSLIYAKNIDQTLLRLHKGRQAHEQKSRLLQRGELINSKKSGGDVDKTFISGASRSKTISANQTMRGRMAANKNKDGNNGGQQNLFHQKDIHHSHSQKNNRSQNKVQEQEQGHHNFSQQILPAAFEQSTPHQLPPTLILDVNLGDKTDRINLYHEDQGRLQQVAEEFAQKHDLDQESKEKLLELLKAQLENVLQKIDESDENDDGQEEEREEE